MTIMKASAVNYSNHLPWTLHQIQIRNHHQCLMTIDNFSIKLIDIRKKSFALLAITSMVTMVTDFLHLLYPPLYQIPLYQIQILKNRI